MPNNGLWNVEFCCSLVVQSIGGHLVYWSVNMRLKTIEGDVMLNLIWRVSLRPAVSVCSYININIPASIKTCPPLLWTLSFLSHLKMPYTERAAAGCGLLKCDRLWLHDGCTRPQGVEFRGKSRWEVPNWGSLCWIQAVLGNVDLHLPWLRVKVTVQYLTGCARSWCYRL